MNFTELVAELFARGTDYLEEDAAGVARAGRWINEGYREILNLHAWPFLETTSSGAAPLAVANLRRVETVLASNVPLIEANRRDLIRDQLDLTVTGTPVYYYILGGSTIHTYPASTDTLTVYYWQRVNELSGTESPIFDEEYHNLIVDLAMVKAYRDSDNFDAALALKDATDTQLAAMAEDYLLNTQGPRYIEVVDPQDG